MRHTVWVTRPSAVTWVSRRTTPREPGGPCSINIATDAINDKQKPGASSRLGGQVLDATVQSVDEHLRRLAGRGQVGDVDESIGQETMDVKNAPAMATRPAVVVLLDDVEVPGHRSVCAAGCGHPVVPKVPRDHQP